MRLANTSVATLDGIPGAAYPGLLRSLEIGSPIAEFDALLRDARVELAVTSQVIRDEVDIIRGTKGSGKSAIYRLIGFMDDTMLAQASTVILKGVEVTGDPIFSKFKTEFAQLDEIDFQNFWRIYFISLINSHFIESPKFRERLRAASKEVKHYRRIANDNGFPISKSLLTYDGFVQWALSKLPGQPKVSIGVGQEGDLNGSLEFAGSRDVRQDKTPLFVTQIHEALMKILEKSGLRLWILLDRLDEVFARRSPVEATALRALLRTSLSYTNETIRLKLFLRDDIFDSITDVDGFTALTHVMSRASDTLKWQKDQILELVVQRVCTSDELVRFFQIRRERVKADKDYQHELFYRIFPRRIRPGAKQPSSLDWIYKHCEDGNGVVTPRDIIDLINFAKTHQLDNLKAQSSDVSSLLSPAAIVYGHQRVSDKKKETYLKAEFDHFWPHIEKFESRKAEHTTDSLRSILGANWRAIAKDLRSIGFLRRNPSSGTYVVPFLYRHCLGIRQGRSGPKPVGLRHK